MQSLAWPYAAAGLAVPAVVYFLTPQSTPAIGRAPGEPEPAVVTSARRRNQRTAATTLGAVGAAAAATVAFGLVKNKNFQSAATGAAIGSAALALLLLATMPAEAAPPILPPTPPGPRPAEPGRSLPAYVAANATLYAQPDVRAAAVRALPRGARIEVETAAPGWVYAYYAPTGLAPAEGYLRIEDISALPVQALPTTCVRSMANPDGLPCGVVVREAVVHSQANTPTEVKLTAGSRVYVLAATEGWLYVFWVGPTDQEFRGFLRSDDVVTIPPTAEPASPAIQPGDEAVVSMYGLSELPGVSPDVFRRWRGPEGVGWVRMIIDQVGEQPPLLVGSVVAHHEGGIALGPASPVSPPVRTTVPLERVDQVVRNGVAVYTRAPSLEPLAAPQSLLLDPNIPASSVLSRPPKVVVSQPSPSAASAAAYLTGEQGEDDALLQDTLKELRERHAAMDAYYRATWRPKYGANLPPTLTAGSEYRSFDTQAGIVAIQLRTAGITKASDEAAIRAALRQSLTTRSVPGFSRHHWGTEVDILTANAREWAPGGRLASLTAFVHDEAPRFGLYTPYKGGAFPEPTRPHYNTEPWHLSLFRRAAPLQTRWLEVVQGPVLETLYDRIAARLGALSDADTARIRRVLPTLDLPSYVRNTAPTPLVSA